MLRRMQLVANSAFALGACQGPFVDKSLPPVLDLSGFWTYSAESLTSDTGISCAISDMEIEIVQVEGAPLNFVGKTVGGHWRCTSPQFGDFGGELEDLAPFSGLVGGGWGPNPAVSFTISSRAFADDMFLFATHTGEINPPPSHDDSGSAMNGLV